MTFPWNKITFIEKILIKLFHHYKVHFSFLMYTVELYSGMSIKSYSHDSLKITECY